ncbi:MAG: queuosine precursor transporter [Candidatus Heimdallarchaeota archaeon]|nr:queuosine precursor transporter [Candidatus Heimdallarchaeota archaeon]MDH5645022.1 queuosine precursor transporter [Candidatus Heimdallarchaeota archaeon]
MNIYILLLLVIFALFFITIITSLYVRKYANADVLVGIYIAFITISQFLATRITLFNFGGNISFAAPAAVIIFPFTFQLTDQVNEKFGRKETHKMIFITFITQIFVVFFAWLSTTMLQLNNDIFSADSYNSIFSSSIRITLASWIAFLFSENFDAILYQYIKKITNDKALWVRNVVSDIISLLIDSIIFVPLAFAGIYPWMGEFSILTIIIGQVITKWIFGLLDTPAIYLSRWLMYGELDEKIPILKKFSPIKN